MQRTIVGWGLFALLLTSGAWAESPSITLSDLNGQSRSPLEVPQNGKAAVVVFVTTDCPIANAAVPELNRIVADYAEKGVSITLVQVVPDLTDDRAKEHAKEYAIEAPVVIDRKHKLVEATGATVTPEAAVYNTKGELVYRGMIDDRFASYGRRRAAVSKPYLRLALDDLLAGREIATPRTEPLGCYIPDLE